MLRRRVFPGFVAWAFGERGGPHPGPLPGGEGGSCLSERHAIGCRADAFFRVLLRGPSVSEGTLTPALSRGEREVVAYRSVTQLDVAPTRFSGFCCVGIR